MTAARTIRTAPRRRRLSESQIKRLVAFPAVRKEITGALRTAPKSVEIPASGDYVHFRLINPKDCVPGMYATLRVGRKGTLLRICTTKKDVRKKGQFRAFLKRMGINPKTGKARRHITDAERKDMIYQMRAAGIIGGAKTQSVLIPRRRVEEAIAKLSRTAEVRRVVGAASNPTGRGCPTGKVRSRKGKCVMPIGYRAKKGKLYGWHTDLPAARRRQILAGAVRKDSYATIVQRLTWLINISHDQPTRRAAASDRTWLQQNRAAIKRAAANPILATLGIGANPGGRRKSARRNPAAEQLNVPFRHGQRISTARMRQWLSSLPNGPMKTQLVRRFEQNMKQYRRFHLGSEPKDFLAQAIPLGSQKHVTDVDFVTSEGKEFAASYQVPRHSGKYKEEVDGRYVHAHGESGIDLTIKSPKKRKKLPERWHTADGRFVGVIPSGNVKIDEWYRG